MSIVKFEIIDTNHIIIDAIINDIAATLIVDTGASASCIDKNVKDKFDLKIESSENRMTGAGSSNLETGLSEDNNLSIGDLKLNNFSFFITDFSHINDALVRNNCKCIDGIIGADVLIEFGAVINYFNQTITFKFN